VTGERSLFGHTAAWNHCGINRVYYLQLHPVFTDNMLCLRDGQSPDLGSGPCLAMAGIDIKPDNENNNNGNTDDHCQTHLFPEDPAFEEFLYAHRMMKY